MPKEKAQAQRKPEKILSLNLKLILSTRIACNNQKNKTSNKILKTLGKRKNLISTGIT